MTTAELMGALRDYLHKNDDVSRLALADAFIEIGDEETADLLRNGKPLYWAWAMGKHKPDPAILCLDDKLHSEGEACAVIRLLKMLMYDDVLGCVMGDTAEAVTKAWEEEWGEGNE